MGSSQQTAASVAVNRLLADVPVLRNASIVAGYRAVRGELDVDTVLAALHAGGVVVTVPRVVDDALEFVPWAPGAESEVGDFGIAEPVGGQPIPFGRHGVILTPLVAFDRRGQRLGQGGGYYDRAIAAAGAKRPVLIGVAHGFQEVEAVPIEDWDQPLDAVVTEREVVEFRPGVTGWPPAAAEKG